MVYMYEGIYQKSQHGLKSLKLKIMLYVVYVNLSNYGICNCNSVYSLLNRVATAQLSLKVFCAYCCISRIAENLLEQNISKINFKDEQVVSSQTKMSYNFKDKYFHCFVIIYEILKLLYPWMQVALWYSNTVCAHVEIIKDAYKEIRYRICLQHYWIYCNQIHIML